MTWFFIGMNTVEKQAYLPDKIAEIESLPPFPLLANLIKAFVTAENDGEIRPLIDSVETEPSVAAKILGLANSAAYASSAEIRSIKDAILKLGIVQLKSLVFSIVIASRFDVNKCPAFQIARFWRESMFLAYCTSLLAEHCDNVQFNRNQVYSIALILRIGMLVLIDLAPNEMNTILAQANEDLLKSERDMFFGIDHYDAGLKLLKHWHLPPAFCCTVANIKDRGYRGECHEIVLLIRRAKELLQSQFSTPQPDIDGKLGLCMEKLECVAETFNNDKSWIVSFSQHL